MGLENQEALTKLCKEMIKLVDDKLSKIGTTVSGGGSIPVTQFKRYASTFTTSDFVADVNDYHLTVPQSVHSTGYNSIVVKFERLYGDAYENIGYQYRQLTNGDFVFIVSEPFEGRFIIEEGIIS